MALVTGGITGAVGAAIAAPLVGLVVGVSTAVVLLVPRLRIVLGISAVAGIVAAGIYVVVTQAGTAVPPGGNWPVPFQTASRWAWAGVVFLAADAVVEAVLSRRRAPGDSADPVSVDTPPRAPLTEGPVGPSDPVGPVGPPRATDPSPIGETPMDTSPAPESSG